MTSSRRVRLRSGAAMSPGPLRGMLAVVGALALGSCALHRADAARAAQASETGRRPQAIRQRLEALESAKPTEGAAEGAVGLPKTQAAATGTAEQMPTATGGSGLLEQKSEVMRLDQKQKGQHGNEAHQDAYPQPQYGYLRPMRATQGQMQQRGMQVVPNYAAMPTMVAVPLSSMPNGFAGNGFTGGRPGVYNMHGQGQGQQGQGQQMTAAPSVYWGDDDNVYDVMSNPDHGCNAGEDKVKNTESVDLTLKSWMCWYEEVDTDGDFSITQDEWKDKMVHDNSVLASMENEAEGFGVSGENKWRLFTIYARLDTVTKEAHVEALTITMAAFARAFMYADLDSNYKVSRREFFSVWGVWNGEPVKRKAAAKPAQQPLHIKVSVTGGSPHASVQQSMGQQPSFLAPNAEPCGYGSPC